MAGAKGYHSYRGRGSRLKILLAILLCLVILAAIGIILLQEHIVFDENGRPHLEIPWQEEPAEEDSPELDLVIEEPEGPPPVQAVLLTQTPVTRADWEAVRAEALGDQAAYAVTVKDSSGKVYLDSKTAIHDAVETAEDTTAVLEELTGTGYSIARLSCLLDPLAARADVEGMGLKNTGGYIFYDGNNLNWLDPAKPGTQAYLGGLAVECAAMGFDEILLTDLSFPTEGKLDKIAYPELGQRESIRALLEALRSALDENGYSDVSLSVELSAAVISTGADETAGLALADLIPLTDRVYAAATTSEQAAALSQAVTAAGGVFVPEVTEIPEGAEEYLLLG